jgi:hypothetical protein
MRTAGLGRIVYLQLDRPLLANLVQHDLFIGHQSEWGSYVSEQPDLKASAATWPPVSDLPD